MRSLFGEIDNQKQISAALAAAWCEIETPKHNAKVKVQTTKGSYDFTYTDLGGIFDAIREPFKKNGLSVQQAADIKTSIAPEHMVKDKWNNLKPTIFIEVQTKITHKSGEYILSPIMSTVVQNGSIQDAGGQITYLKRYSLSALIGVSTEKDDDANGSLGNGYDDGYNNYKPNKQQQYKQQQPQQRYKQPQQQRQQYQQQQPQQQYKQQQPQQPQEMTIEQKEQQAYAKSQQAASKEHKTDITPALYKQVVDLTIKVSNALGEEGNDFYKRVAKQLKLDENFKLLNNADAPKVVNLMLEIYEEHKAKTAGGTNENKDAAETKKETVKK